MSEKARELAVWFVKHYGLEPDSPNDDGTCDKCVSEIDAAVAPLVEALEKARDFIATLPQDCMGETGMDMTSDDGQHGYMTWPIRDEWIHNTSKALEGWKQ